MKQSATETLVAALRIIASEIECDDGVVPAMLLESAQRLQEQHLELIDLRREILARKKHGVDAKQFEHLQN